jgi:hypothetical protein
MVQDAWLKSFKAVPFGGKADALFQGRFDTKYVFSEALLPGLLEKLSGAYRVIEYAGRAVQAYQSLYFDDERLTLYQDHQCGRLSRAKVRFRLYESTGFACAEIKMKTNRKQTRKWRRTIDRDRFETGRLPEGWTELAAGAPVRIPAGLQPRLQVRFRRLTLYGRAVDERLTFDTDLAYTDVRTGRSLAAGGFAVAEIKQGRRRAASPFRDLMREMRIAPAWFSKYCYGIFRLCPEARHNRLRPRYRALARTLAAIPAGELPGLEAAGPAAR